MNLKIFILNMIVPLIILNRSTRLLHLLFSLNFLKTLPCWYTKNIMFFLFVLIISFYFFIIFIASSQPSTLMARVFQSSMLMFSLQTSESINCFLTSSFCFSLLSLDACLILSKSFFNYKKKIDIKLNLCKITSLCC